MIEGAGSPLRRSVALAAEILDRVGLVRLALGARRRGLLPGGGLTVLAYHRIADPADLDGFDPDLVDATPAEFEAQMAHLAKHFHPVTIEEVLAAHRSGEPLPPNSVLLSFDDGYRDNYEQAFPILKRHGLPAVFFITTGHLSERRLFWWERINMIVRESTRGSARIEYPGPETLDLSSPAGRKRAIRLLARIVKDSFGLDLGRFLGGLGAACGVERTEAEWNGRADRALMTWEHVRTLRAAGMGIGSHTRNHRVLQTLAPPELAAELSESRATLEAELREPVTTIAYPVGRSIAELGAVRQAVVDAGYELGFTMIPGLNPRSADADPYDLKRLSIDRGVPVGIGRLRVLFPALGRLM